VDQCIIWEKRNGTTPQAQFGNELEGLTWCCINQ
jgi:hypothetical protein